MGFSGRSGIYEFPRFRHRLSYHGGPQVDPNLPLGGWSQNGGGGVPCGVPFCLGLLEYGQECVENIGGCPAHLAELGRRDGPGLDAGWLVSLLLTDRQNSRLLLLRDVVASLHMK